MNSIFAGIEMTWEELFELEQKLLRAINRLQNNDSVIAFEISYIWSDLWSNAIIS